MHIDMTSTVIQTNHLHDFIGNRTVLKTCWKQPLDNTVKSKGNPHLYLLPDLMFLVIVYNVFLTLSECFTVLKLYHFQKIHAHSILFLG